MRQQEPAKDEERDGGRRHERAPQVVEDLPAVQRGERVELVLAGSIGNAAPQPRQGLPVAAHPAVQPRGSRKVVGRIVVEHLDVAREPRAQERAFNQVVAEQRVVGEAAVEHALEHVDLEDALAGERSLAEDVLIGVGHRAGVGIDAGRSRVQRGETAALRPRKRHPHSRLDEPVAARHARLARTPARPVERMRDRRDELPCSVSRQDRVGVEGDDERARMPKRLVAELGGERGVGRATHLAHQLQQRAALSLPAHPEVLGLVELPRANQQMERTYAVLDLVALVQFRDPTDRRLGDQPVVGPSGLLGRP